MAKPNPRQTIEYIILFLVYKFQYGNVFGCFFFIYMHLITKTKTHTYFTSIISMGIEYESFLCVWRQQTISHLFSQTSYGKLFSSFFLLKCNLLIETAQVRKREKENDISICLRTGIK